MIWAPGHWGSDWNLWIEAQTVSINRYCSVEAHPWTFDEKVQLNNPAPWITRNSFSSIFLCISLYRLFFLPFASSDAAHLCSKNLRPKLPEEDQFQKSESALCCPKTPLFTLGVQNITLKKEMWSVWASPREGALGLQCPDVRTHQPRPLSRAWLASEAFCVVSCTSGSQVLG